MFNSISWNEFLSAIGLIAGGYYVISTLLLYSTEIKSIFTQRVSDSVNSNDSEQNQSNESNNLLGPVRNDVLKERSEESVASEELRFAPASVSEEPIHTSSLVASNTVMIGAIADLLEEIKTVVADLSEPDPKEVAILFQQLLLGHPELVNTSYQQAITIFIFTSLIDASIQIELNEVKSWWPAPVKNSTI